MRFLLKAFALMVLAAVAQTQLTVAQQSQPSGISDNPHTPAQSGASSKNANLVVPAGTQVVLALTGPVWARSAHIGDPIYAVTAFPVSINNILAIPPGTYVEGQIDALTRPTRKTNRAEFQMHFTKLVFANGYTVELPVAGTTQPAQTAAANNPLAQREVRTVNAAVTAAVHVDVYFTSDVLLDNGSQIEATFQSPIALDAASVMAAARLSRAPQLTWTSATRCRPTAGTPGTPGTPDTVIPGSPGTPDTVIPGGPGMPDTVIPGTPASPATVIPGTPGTAGTPGISCPGPPSVISEAGDTHRESFKLGANAKLAGQLLFKGSYQAIWNGPGPSAQVQIVQKGNVVATVPARVATLLDKSPKSSVDTSPGPSATVLAIQFKGKTYALSFDSGSTTSITQASAKTP